MKKTIAIMLAFAICATLCACTTTCSRCDGEGMITCPQCVDGWKKVCYKCREGKIYSECEYCDGEGIDTWQAQWCKSCDSKGYAFNSYTLTYQRCSVCSGDGRYYPDCSHCEDGEIIQTCSCNGNYREICTNCDSGMVSCPECG